MRPAVAVWALALLTGDVLGAAPRYAGRGDGDECLLEGSVTVNGTFSDALFQATVGSQTIVLWVVRYNRSAVARVAAGGRAVRPTAARANASAKVWAYELGLGAEDDDDNYYGGESATTYYQGLCTAAGDRNAAASAPRAGHTSYDLTGCTVNYTHPWEGVECVQLLLYPYGDGARLRFGLSVCDANVSSLTYRVTVHNAQYVSACPHESSLAVAVGVSLVALGAVLLVVGLCCVYRRQRAASGGSGHAATRSDAGGSTAEERVELNAASAAAAGPTR